MNFIQFQVRLKYTKGIKYLLYVLTVDNDNKLSCTFLDACIFSTWSTLIMEIDQRYSSNLIRMMTIYENAVSVFYCYYILHVKLYRARSYWNGVGAWWLSFARFDTWRAIIIFLVTHTKRTTEQIFMIIWLYNVIVFNVACTCFSFVFMICIHMHISIWVFNILAMRIVI